MSEVNCDLGKELLTIIKIQVIIKIDFGSGNASTVNGKDTVRVERDVASLKRNDFIGPGRTSN